MPLDHSKPIAEAALEPRMIRPERDEGLLIGAGIRDRSERKKLERQLKEKERLAELGRMADIFAHEIANPLQGILTTLELIKESIPGEYFDLLNDLTAEASNLESLLKQFRSFSKLSDLNLTSVDLTRLVDRIVRIYRRYWSGLGIRVVTDFARDLTLEADSVRLHQLVVNLSRNALRSMPDGGSLTLRTYATGEGVVLEVSDTGRGLAEDGEAFEVFTSMKAQAKGIGMYVVQQIVLAHGGTIAYFSTHGAGTIFRLTLPRKTNPKADAL